MSLDGDLNVTEFYSLNNDVTMSLDGDLNVTELFSLNNDVWLI